MADRRPTIAVSWAGACGGCDVALLDAEERILDLALAADLVYWPVALDFKRSDLEARPPGSVDVGIFNGMVRTDEHAADARLMRDRCRYLVAFGACAAFGGIPGLANLHRTEEILDTVYGETASTDNPDAVRPQPSSSVGGRTLELPALEPRVRALHQVVEVDLVVPGCPPPRASVDALIDAVLTLAAGGRLPPTGTVLASDGALCDDCPRTDSRTGRRLSVVRRPHEVAAEQDLCFNEQGILCLGLATRGGCGATCIAANMPCRGCFGPMPGMLDPAAEALSAIGSLAGLEHEDGVPPPRRLAPARSIKDLAGTFYRFTLPVATVPGRIEDRPDEGGSHDG